MDPGGTTILLNCVAYDNQGVASAGFHASEEPLSLSDPLIFWTNRISTEEAIDKFALRTTGIVRHQERFVGKVIVHNEDFMYESCIFEDCTFRDVRAIFVGCLFKHCAGPVEGWFSGCTFLTGTQAIEREEN